MKKDPELIECRLEPSFSELLKNLDGSLIISTYQAGKVIIASCDDKTNYIQLRDFDQPMGIATTGASLAVATDRSIELYSSDSDAPGLVGTPFAPGFDASFVPRISLHTGQLMAHEMVFDEHGELLFCNTLYSCLCVPSQRYRFEPVWYPKFVSQLVAEDRCHLNGIAIEEGRAKYVSCLAATDTREGWRTQRLDGGCVVDLQSNEIVSQGWCMPHSPRCVGSSIWLLNSGRGEVVSIDLASGKFDVVKRLPGFLRGLAICGGIAFVGMSRLRDKSQFQGLPIQSSLIPLKCAIAAIEVSSGRLLGFLDFISGCSEIFDVQLVPKFKNPKLSGHSLPRS